MKEFLKMKGVTVENTTIKPILQPGQPVQSKRYGLCAFVRWEGDDGVVIQLLGGVERVVHWNTLTVL